MLFNHKKNIYSSKNKVFCTELAKELLVSLFENAAADLSCCVTIVMK